MRETKVYKARLKKDLDQWNVKGNILRLEFETRNKVSICSNNEWMHYFYTIKSSEVEQLFEDVTYLETRCWKKV